MQQVLLILHVLVCVSIVILVLLQHGKGADMGAAFGSGSSNTMFGSAGAVPFLMKLTALCATIFFLTSLTLGYLARSQVDSKKSIYDMSTQPAEVDGSKSTTPTMPKQ